MCDDAPESTTHRSSESVARFAKCTPEKRTTSLCRHATAEDGLGLLVVADDITPWPQHRRPLVKLVAASATNSSHAHLQCDSSNCCGIVLL
jgi:hypothetical protein